MTVNPFNINSLTVPSGSPKTSTATVDTNFEQQLSSAIAESLGKLGVTPGEVNITVRNDGTPAHGRQITVSYHIDDNTVAAPATTVSAGKTQPAASPAPPVQDWAPYNGPRDKRDAMPVGGGDVTASGVPVIALSKDPAANQYGYTGMAARNPYFTTPSNPLRPGYVLGFQNWFEETSIMGGASGPVAANKVFYASTDGADEALRLVQQLVPDAKITSDIWSGGIFSANKPTYSIEFSDGRKFNAGGLLASYYNQGYGVTASSDDTLKRVLGLAA